MQGGRWSRVAVIGISGSGKSTLGRVLAGRMGMPLIHADAMEWMPGWVEREPETVVELDRQTVLGERWVIEGWVDASKAGRLRAAELVLDLDLPRWVCAARVARRMWVGGRREELPEGCVDGWSWRFLWTVLTGAERGAIGEALRAGRPGNYVRIRSGRELRQWLRGL